jgi:hypothetical protein
MKRNWMTDFYQAVILLMILHLLQRQFEQRDHAFNHIISKLKQPHQNPELGTKKNNGQLTNKRNRE